VSSEFAAGVDGNTRSDEALDVAAGDVGDAEPGVADGVVVGVEPSDAAIVEAEREA